METDNLTQQEFRGWVQWHRSYDDPTSSLSRRLLVVQDFLRRAIDDRPGPLRIISMCAGEGRDVVGVLAKHPRRDEISARLVELDLTNIAFAEAAVHAAGLERVEVAQGDAATTDSYTGAVPADIVLACGVFGNITDDDVRRTVEHLSCLCAPGATVLWTRGRERHRDAALMIREWFLASGFEEIAFAAPDDDRFRVGMYRLVARPRAFEPGVRLFTFLR
ncbi:MAG TPA: class I SAM-dependent methyltransferase family protein [Dehalococcoidia bacterium]